MDLHPENNKKFAELVEKCWHEPRPRLDWLIKNDKMECCHCHQWLKVKFTSVTNTVIFIDNPDYAADPRLVLREMTREQRLLFLRSLAICPDHFIKVDLILDTSGKLRDAAIEWLKEKKC